LGLGQRALVGILCIGDFIDAGCGVAKKIQDLIIVFRSNFSITNYCPKQIFFYEQTLKLSFTKKIFSPSKTLVFLRETLRYTFLSPFRIFWVSSMELERFTF
jgi:hypothetical protein